MNFDFKSSAEHTNSRNSLKIELTKTSVAQNDNKLTDNIISYRRDGVLVRASASQLVDLVFIY